LISSVLIYFGGFLPPFFCGFENEESLDQLWGTFLPRERKREKERERKRKSEKGKFSLIVANCSTPSKVAV